MLYLKNQVFTDYMNQGNNDAQFYLTTGTI